MFQDALKRLEYHQQNDIALAMKHLAGTRASYRDLFRQYYGSLEGVDEPEGTGDIDVSLGVDGLMLQMTKLYRRTDAKLRYGWRHRWPEEPGQWPQSFLDHLEKL
tara:strand:- start:194 stop:508 length:315 start_codon:yes stop_codon:yes gene_type:complete